MTETEILDRLCTAYGIAIEYEDFWGELRTVSDESKRALLSAMDVGVATSAQMQEALRRHEVSAWQRTLPPVHVAAEQQAIAFAITLPAMHIASSLTWRLTQENGEQHAGEFNSAQLERREERDIDGERRLRGFCTLPVQPPPGYHDLELSDGALAEPQRMRLIVTPARCYLPPALQDSARVWGLGVQLYSLRSQRNWGMGDFTDLKTLVDLAAELGADVVGVNPLHALYTRNPKHASPYSPSSRLFLNVLYLDVDAAVESDDCAEAREAIADQEFQAALRALRADEVVDYPAVAARKLRVLELLFRCFRARHLDTPSERGRAFHDYRAAQGENLRLYALFEALHEHLHAADPEMWGWPVWPEAYRDPHSQAVAAFAVEKASRIEFFEYLQWLAEEQLDAVGRRSLERHLDVGVYTDLAVGADSGGAEVWSNQSLYALDARIGAPPDGFNLKGQNWGLPPLKPNALIDSAYAPYIAALRHNMRHAGALRIDHVMGLLRLFWVPPGRPPDDGSYVTYPLHDMLGILALESRRNRCLVIGEDLGTVPHEVREALQAVGALSYRLLYFEKDAEGDFLPPAEFPAQAAVAISTHDLPPLNAFWRGTDLERRAEFGLFPNDTVRKQQIVGRAQDRAQLLLALEREGLLPAGLRADPATVNEMSDELMIAVHAYLARSASQLMIVQPEDVFGQCEQINLPGTIDECPNWRRKLVLNLDAWRSDMRIQALARTLGETRGRPEEAAAAHAASAPHDAGLGVPTATYRLQFNRDFTFAMAAELVPYLDALGVSHCYASPYLKARPGSEHGYDIIDHNALNPEIGSLEDFERFVAALREHRMSHILDMVPNHMGVMGADNAWWLDVLENGPASAYADFFDIDWEAMRGPYRHKVLLPVLGDHYGVVLERGELQLRFDSESGAFSVCYFDHRFPIDPKEYPSILSYHSERLAARLGADNADLLEYESLIAAFRNLPARNEAGAAALAERQRDKELHKNKLAAMCRRSADIARYAEENVALFNGRVGEPESFHALHQLIQTQAYRLAYWRVASDEINYRRFFDVNDLAALSMENAQVFTATHHLVGELLSSGKIGGLRIDHPDGLYDPQQYFERLQTLVPPSNNAGETTVTQRLPYVIVEKILAHYEHLPASWPVHGTTGYEFVNLLNGLFVDAEAEAKLDRLYTSFIHDHIDFGELLYHTKKLIMRVSMASELGVLANRLLRIAQAESRICDFTLNSLRDALSEVVACFPVYRTYITEAGPSTEDRRYIDWAVSVAKRRSQAADISIFDFVRDVLLTVAAEGKPEPYRRAVINFAMKFQQYTGPLMAKGLEDTSFYRYNRLISLNEVGGDPRRFATSVAEFHRANQDRLLAHPHTLLATSTHDTKRSEDVRMRIDVLSELHDVWRKHLSRWSRLNRGKKRIVNDEPAPSRNDEYLLYQTLIGAWPLAALDEAGLLAFAERIEAYMLKALREAKVHTSWINPNAEYEEAVKGFVQALLKPSPRNPFLADLVPLVQRLARFGLYNGLAEITLKFTVPGVPDIYQGNELWDFSLVDPDNRRAVDYALRRERLATIQTWYADDAQRVQQLRALMEHLADGDAKLFVTWRLLSLRRERRALFQRGSYLPLTAEGAHAAHLCAYARAQGDNTLLVCVPRLFARLMGEREHAPLGPAVWSDTRIEVPAPRSARGYVDVFSGERVRTQPQGDRQWIAAAELFSVLPVAVLLDDASS